MTEQALRKMIAAGESTRQEFKSWVKCKDYRQRKELAVKSAVALANTKGGVLLFGVEDDGTITGYLNCVTRLRGSRVPAGRSVMAGSAVLRQAASLWAVLAAS